MTEGVRTVAERQTVEGLLDQVRRRGGRATLARRLLLEALHAQTRHRSAEELTAIVQARAPAVNISTIYRNLDELERLHIVDRTYPGPGPATYHLATTAHGHLACEQCGQVTEIPARIFTALASEIRDTYGFTIAPHRFAVTGTCAQCAPPDNPLHGKRRQLAPGTPERGTAPGGRAAGIYLPAGHEGL